MCPLNVFDIEDMGGVATAAVAARPRDCTMCRECIRHKGWDERLSFKRVADHFLFSVESVGSIPPETIVREVRVLLLFANMANVYFYHFCRPFQYLKGKQ